MFRKHSTELLYSFINSREVPTGYWIPRTQAVYEVSFNETINQNFEF